MQLLAYSLPDPVQEAQLTMLTMATGELRSYGLPSRPPFFFFVCVCFVKKSKTNLDGLLSILVRPLPAIEIAGLMRFQPL